MVNIRDFITPFGTLKNPVLFSSTGICVIILYFFHEPHGDTLSEVTAVIMLFIAILIFLIGLGFYIYAFLRLPSSTQELLFLQEGKLAVARYNRSAAKPRSKAGTEDD